MEPSGGSRERDFREALDRHSSGSREVVVPGNPEEWRALARGDFGAEFEFKDAASTAADRFEKSMTNLSGDWRVIVGFWSPPRDTEAVYRTLAVLVVPSNPQDAPPGGLTQPKLQELLTGIGSDLAARVDAAGWRRLHDRLGIPMDEKAVRALENDLRRSARKTSKSRSFGADFYARIALDAIRERRRDVIQALLIRYGLSDPRPKNKRGKSVSYAMVRTWVSTARNEYRFLPPAGGRGKGVFTGTDELQAYLIEREGKNDDRQNEA